MCLVQAGNLVDDDLEEEELEFSDDEKVLFWVGAAPADCKMQHLITRPLGLCNVRHLRHG